MDDYSYVTRLDLLRGASGLAAGPKLVRGAATIVTGRVPTQRWALDVTEVQGRSGVPVVDIVLPAASHGVWPLLPVPFKDSNPGKAGKGGRLAQTDCFLAP